MCLVRALLVLVVLFSSFAFSSKYSAEGELLGVLEGFFALDLSV